MRRYWLQWLTFAILAVMLVTLTGCRSVKYIPVTEYRDRYVSKTDTVAVHDSIPYPVKVEVEKRQSALDKVFTWLGKMAGILFVVFTVLIVHNLVRKH